MMFNEMLVADLDTTDRVITAASSQTHKILRDLLGHDAREEMLGLTARARGSVQVGVASSSRVPLLAHRIWLTNPSNPSDPSESYAGNQAYRINKGFRAREWRHIFWSNVPECLEGFQRQVETTSRKIEVLSYQHFITSPWIRLIEALIADRKYVFASDILRLSILEKFGGIYLDMGFGFEHPIDNITKIYDYAYIAWPEERILQNSFIMTPPGAAFLKQFKQIADDPYCVPQRIFGDATASKELHLFAGPMLTYLVLNSLRDMDRVGVLMPNRLIVNWKAQQSWHGKPKFGNVPIQDAKASYLRKNGWAGRQGGATFP